MPLPQDKISNNNSIGDHQLNLEYFKGRFLYGHRGHHFHVMVEFPNSIPGGVDAQNYVSTYAKGSKIPENVIEAIEIPWHGNKIAVAGDKTTTNTIDVEFWYDDNYEDGQQIGNNKLRTLFEQWSDYIISIKSSGENIRSYPHQYKGRLTTRQWQLNKSKVATGIWHYVGVWPENVGEMEQSHENGEIMGYTISFRYDWQYNSSLKPQGA